MNILFYICTISKLQYQVICEYFFIYIKINGAITKPPTISAHNNKNFRIA